ncbi:GNAT family N-acetyltransferase [Gracilibacillus sp. S3-1-1]|uniref:GNAT family N-acetyltransferase n=1 Tax=Gracilibacillus pellucidus TaxID=3095368 RepID=A0ACC6M265_9BACI|nr:GNAT family N-acetyltransferase [Gracilibacillus sp. S3-1-1]MDX8044986.1 GNAT family N-acetyltransferase [Gracilibacillus sp. S3-1-1]
MKIYCATMEDLEEVSTLFNLYRVFYQQPSNLQDARVYIKNRLENEDSVIFIVKDEQKCVGFTQLYPTFSSISMKRAWILNDLYVDVKFRRQGIAELLLHKAKEFAISTGANSITLTTAVDNYAAQQLYQKNEYKRDSHFYHYDLALTN